MDILERLKNYRYYRKLNEDGSPLMLHPPICDEAAAEIERLRVRLSKAERDVGHAERIGNEAEGEVARLLEASENSVSRETLMATEAERDEAREAARWLYTAWLGDFAQQRYAGKTVEERWPWLEEGE